MPSDQKSIIIQKPEVAPEQQISGLFPAVIFLTVLALSATMAWKLSFRRPQIMSPSVQTPIAWNGFDLSLQNAENSPLTVIPLTLPADSSADDILDIRYDFSETTHEGIVNLAHSGGKIPVIQGIQFDLRKSGDLPAPEHLLFILRNHEGIVSQARLNQPQKSWRRISIPIIHRNITTLDGISLVLDFEDAGGNLRGGFQIKQLEWF